MTAWLLDALTAVVGAALLAVVLWVYWWETSGRREAEREEWRRGMVERLPPGKRGERLWTDDEDDQGRRMKKPRRGPGA